MCSLIISGILMNYPFVLVVILMGEIRFLSLLGVTVTLYNPQKE